VYNKNSALTPLLESQSFYYSMSMQELY